MMHESVSEFTRSELEGSVQFESLVPFALSSWVEGRAEV